MQWLECLEGTSNWNEAVYIINASTYIERTLNFTQAANECLNEYMEGTSNCTQAVYSRRATQYNKGTSNCTEAVCSLRATKYMKGNRGKFYGYW